MQKTAMVVFNDIVSDNRVLKTARIMKKMSSQFVLIGVDNHSSALNVPTEKKIHGIPCLIFPRPVTIGGMDYSKHADQKKFQFWELGTETLTQNIIEYLSEIDVDCIHTHDMYTLKIGYETKKLRVEIGKKSVWFHDVHEYAYGATHLPELYRVFALEQEAKYLPLADHVLAVTDTLKARLEAVYELKNPISVIHNSPNFPIVSCGKSIRSDVGTSELLAVYVGNVEPGKGVERFFKCVVICNQLHYAIVAKNQGPYINNLKKMAQDLGITNRIHWLPDVPPEQVSSYIADADFGVIPFEKGESTGVLLPKKLFDYIFGAIPVISSDLEAVSKFLFDNPVGTICDFDDEEAILNAVQRAAKLDVTEPRSRIIANFRWGIQEKTLASLYEKTVGNRTVLLTGDRVPSLKTKNMKLKVLHGVTGAAGQPGGLAKALSNLPGIEARSLQISRAKFNYVSDYFFPVDTIQPADMAEVFKSVAGSFDIFHFHFRPFFFSPTQANFPIGYDIMALKAMNKRVCVHFRGSEVRLRSRFLELNPYAYDTETDADVGSAFSEAAQIEYIRRMSALADRVFVVDPELQTYVPDATIVERAIDVDEWSYVGVHDRDRPLIVHAPSRRGTKGTNKIVEILEMLQAQGLEFDYQLVEGLSNQEARKVYERADIVIDQMRIGWYGVLSVEAMALGKAVVCYIRRDLEHHLGDEPPLTISNLERLAEDLTRLISDKAYRTDLGRRARIYCEQLHSAQAVAAKLAKIYAEIHNNPRPLSPEVMVDMFLDDLVQLQAAQEMTKQLNVQLEKAVLPLLETESEKKQLLTLKERERKFRARIETLNAAITTLKQRVDSLKTAVEKEKRSRLVRDR